MQLKVFFFSGGVVKRFLFEQSFPSDPQRIPSIQGRLLPVECDPSLWKCAVVEQVHLDCASRKVSCFFIDGSVQVFPMTQACYAKLIAAISKLDLVSPASPASPHPSSPSPLSSLHPPPSSSGMMETGADSVSALPGKPAPPASEQEEPLLPPPPTPRHKQLSQAQVVSRARSEILNAFQRFVISELKLPQNSALWSAESTLAKLEKKLAEVDLELDQKSKAIAEKKRGLRELRSAFFQAAEREDQTLASCSGVFLECALEGIELDIADSNKDLSLLQASVERLKIKAALLSSPPPSPPASPPATSTFSAFRSEEGEAEEEDEDEPGPRGAASLCTSSTSPTTGPTFSDSLVSPTSPAPFRSPTSPTPYRSPVLVATEEELVRARGERDELFAQLTKLLELREQIKLQLRAQYRSNAGSATEASKEGGSRSFPPEEETHYVALFRQLKTLREARDSLSEEKMMVVNARENSKMEIRNIHESLAFYRQRVEEEKNKKRRARKQSHAARAARHHQAAQTIPV